MKDLTGKKVELVRYMSDKEMKDTGWFKKPIIIQFTDDTLLISQSDDEGNDGGSYSYTGDKMVGKTIKSVFYMTDAEMKMRGWYKKPVVIIFNDGTRLIPQCDEEGNDGGVFAFQGITEDDDYLFYTER